MSSLLPRLLLIGVAVVAAWESVSSLRPPRISDGDVHALAVAVRAAHSPGELIAVAPAWLSPLVQRELGDLMPVEHLSRPDAKRFARITEVSLPSFHSPDVSGLVSDGTQRFGLLQLTRYQQTPVTVPFDLTEHFLDVTVSQVPQHASDAVERPCLWTGPLPGTTAPAPGLQLGGFSCGSTRSERRTMEIDYQPRRGIVTDLESGHRTLLRFSIPDDAWQGSTLHLWLGLHDYHQRKQAQGPANVTVDLDDGQAKKELTIEVRQGFVHHELALPQRRADVHHVRIELSAQQAPHHLVGLHGELRR